MSSIEDQLRAFQAFIAQYPHVTLGELPLKIKDDSGFSASFGTGQLKGRTAASTKFPSLVEKTDFVFPPKVSVEQASSEATADFKASLMKGDAMADLTGGMGMDSFAWSKSYEHVDYVEMAEEPALAMAHNSKVLGIKNLTVHWTDASSFLENTSACFDLIYLDPSRRDESQRRVVDLEDLVPNVLELIPRLWDRTASVLVKLSPMLDIRTALEQLPLTADVWIVSVRNECKELLFHLKPDASVPAIHCIDIYPERTDRLSLSSQISASPILADDMGSYLYDPNTSVRKARAWDQAATDFGLLKLHRQTPLFTSHELHTEFPGRIFRVVKQVKPDRKTLRKELPDMEAMLVVRNFPESVDILRKKWKLRDGGHLFLIATTIWDGSRMLIVCERVK